MSDFIPDGECPRLRQREVGREESASVALIGGPSARVLLWAATGALFGCIGVALTAGLLMLVWGAVPTWLIRASSLCVLSTLLCATLGWLGGRVQGRREAKAGYTSLPNRYRELPQLDVRSGKTTREAGDPYHRPYGRAR